jgi:hypothetical protein
MTTNSSAILRSCPARTCEEKGVYPTDTIFAVRQQYGDSDLWYRGSTPDGNEGWIYSALLTKSTKSISPEQATTTATNTPSHEKAKTPEVNQDAPVIKKNGWKKFISWFSFWK